MSYQFNRWTITLGAQVQALYESMPYKASNRLKSEVETYEAELQQLYTYAKEHDLDLIKYYRPFAEIEDRLLLIREGMQYRQTNVG